MSFASESARSGEERPPVVHRVRTRLLAAFLALVTSALVLAAMGGYGMRSAEVALDAFQGELLPNVTQALELAQRASRLAALTPNVAIAVTPEELHTQSNAARALLQEIGKRVQELPAEAGSELGPVLARMQGDVSDSVEQLVVLTGERQQLQAALRQRAAEIEAMTTNERLRPANTALGIIWSQVLLALTADDMAMLGRLEADTEAAGRLMDKTWTESAWPPGLLHSMKTMAEGDNSVFALRRRQIQLERNSTYIVLLTLSHANRLSAEVDRYVAHLRQRAATQRDGVRAAINAGARTILAVSLVALFVASMATRFVHRLVGEIERLTGMMHRLSIGDLSQPGPALTRPDELGSLARTFQVFRGALAAERSLLEDLDAQRSLLFAVHENMTDALAVFDDGENLILFNERLRRALVRLGLDARLGMPFADLVQSLPVGTVWREMPTSGQRGKDELNMRGMLASGQVELSLPGSVTYTLRSRGMPGGGMVTLLTDETDSRQLQRQMLQAQRLDTMGRLTGGMAHDFNNHLATIIGNLEIAGGHAGNAPGLPEPLRLATTAAYRAAALTRRLLAFARRQQLEMELVDVDATIEEMRDLIEYSAGTRTEVRLEMNASGAQVLIDRSQLENALLNLVLNSAAAMAEGGVLKISTCPIQNEMLDTNASALVEIRVADTGHGVPEEIVPKVFDPFFTTKPAGQGSGLGLSTVYGFVKQSGGAVALHSREGVGTEIVLQFAVVRRHYDAPDTPVEWTEGASFNDLRILVVDDDEAFGQTLVVQLEGQGAQVCYASRPSRALEMLEDHHIQVLLTDVELDAEINGSILAAMACGRNPSLLAVLMSGLPTQEVLRHASEASVSVPILSKPFPISALSTAIARVRALQQMKYCAPGSAV